MTIKTKLLLFAFGCVFFLSSFVSTGTHEKHPNTITRVSNLVDGKKIETTIILLDGTTSREDLIATCSFLAKENVQLTFDKLAIGRSFLGIIGKQRIRIAEGQVRLPDGSSQSFKAGGIASFRSIKIQYSSDASSHSSKIQMIEIID